MAERPTRVLVVSLSLNKGGAERVTSTLLRSFDRSKVRASLALLRMDIGYPLPDDVPVHGLRYRGILTFLSTARRLSGLIEAEAPDVVLSNVNATNLITGWALRRCATQPRWVARVGANPEDNDRGLRRWVAKRVYGRADCIVVNSRGLGEEVRRRYHALVDRVVTVANPTDFAEIDRLAGVAEGPPRRPGVPVVVAVGRLFRQKRYDVMLRALARVRAERDVELWICGDGPERRKLGALAKRLGIDGSIRWLGFQANPYAVMKRADVFLMTSDFEGLPNALIEAQGLGIPAVATRCPHGPEEIVEDRVTGLLAPVGDVRAISNALGSLLQRPDLRAAMGLGARGRVRQLFGCPGPLTVWESVLLGREDLDGGSEG